MKGNRLPQIEAYVKAHGNCSVAELSREFGVSQITVRRDIAALVAQGTLYKTYGGVSSLAAAGEPKPGPEAGKQQVMGKTIAALVHDGDTVFLDEGAAIAQSVPFLAAKRNITILTNSLSVLQAAARSYSLDVICLGGKLQHSTDSLIGNFDENFHCRKAFISAESASIEYGVGNSNFFNGVIKRLAIEKSDLSFLVLDAQGFSEQSYNIFAKLNAFRGIVSDSRPPEKIVDFCLGKTIDLYCGAYEKACRETP